MIGLEETPDQWTETLVAVFREAHRVLRPDGTLWIVVGDAYSHGGHGARDPDRWPKQSRNDHHPTHGKTNLGCKPKDLLGLPWILAFALRADGWYLRQAITWCKVSPMPESVTDRCTCATEMLFMFARSKRYYYDALAIAEPAVSQHGSGNGYARPARLSVDGRGSETPWEPQATRNRRNWWVIGPDPLKDEHYAAYPEKLVEPCILAGCPPGGTVLDPFSGSGTTCRVATRLGRRSIGIELNPEYVAMAERRTSQGGLGV